jgi:hypothetical protein
MIPPAPSSLRKQGSIRGALVLLHFALSCAMAAWFYAGHRYNGLNIGGATGDVNLWVRVGDIGYFATLGCWLLCVVAAILAGWADMFASKRERIFWAVLSVVSAPVALLGNAAFISAFGIGAVS